MGEHWNSDRVDYEAERLLDLLAELTPRPRKPYVQGRLKLAEMLGISPNHLSTKVIPRARELCPEWYPEWQLVTERSSGRYYLTDVPTKEQLMSEIGTIRSAASKLLRATSICEGSVALEVCKNYKRDLQVSFEEFKAMARRIEAEASRIEKRWKDERAA